MSCTLNAIVVRGMIVYLVSLQVFENVSHRSKLICLIFVCNTGGNNGNNGRIRLCDTLWIILHLIIYQMLLIIVYMF